MFHHWDTHRGKLLLTLKRECARISNAPQYAKWLTPKVVERANYAASPISEQMTWPKMKDFELTSLCLPGKEPHSISDQSAVGE